MHDLAALGFGPKVIAEFTPLFPGGKIPAGLSNITRDDLTEGQIHYSEILFSGPVIAGLEGGGRGGAVGVFQQDVGARRGGAAGGDRRICARLPTRAQVENAKALVAEAQLLLDHVHAAHEAGTAANLDELRARVQLEAQQQALIAAQNQQAKELILLKREIGIDPGQEITLTDPAPYSELAEQTPEEVRALAYRSRQDYQNLQNQAVEYKALHAVYRSERLPTLSFTATTAPAP